MSTSGITGGRMEFDVDTDTAVFQALRLFRNAFVAFARSRLQPEFGEGLNEEIEGLFAKEWAEIQRSAKVARETGLVDREPTDALDYLSVSHVYVLIEKYWTQLSPDMDATSDLARRKRTQLTAWARELTGIRNPVSHPPEASLALPDALRCVDSATRILRVLEIEDAARLRGMWLALLNDESSDSVAPPAAVDTLPSREQVTVDFVGRAEHLADLWRWLGDDMRRVWALAGDGGKGKTTIAYEFASQAKPVLSSFGYQGVLWLSAKRLRYVEGEVVPIGTSDFADLDSALNYIFVALGWDEELDSPLDRKLERSLELLTEFPLLIVADDIDTLEEEDEQAVEFFVQHVPQTRSKALLTSRRRVFGLSACTTEVAGLSEQEVAELLRRRAATLDLGWVTPPTKVVRQIRNITDGSPLYIEDLLRLAQFYSLDHAMNQWAGRAGDDAREYSLRRELEKLSPPAGELLEVLAYSDSPLSMQECAVVVGQSDDRAVSSMEELLNWNLLPKPGLVEDVPRYTCSRNLAKLLRRTMEGSDEERRIRNGLKGLRGQTVMSSRLRSFIQQAVALKQAGKQEDAERTLLQGLEEVPNAGEVHAMLGWLYSKWQPRVRIADAQEHFGRAEGLGSIGRDLYAHWADMEFTRGEYRNAIEICERYFAGDAGDDPFIWRIAGLAYTKLALLHRESLSTEQATDAFARADRALLRAQELSRTDGDLSRALQARYRYARALPDATLAQLVLDDWRERMPADPFLASLRR